jgi:hypothetical protein
MAETGMMETALVACLSLSSLHVPFPLTYAKRLAPLNAPKCIGSPVEIGPWYRKCLNLPTVVRMKEIDYSSGFKTTHPLFTVIFTVFKCYLLLTVDQTI